MMWLAELSRRVFFALAMWLALAAVAQAEPAVTNASAPELPAATVSNALPAWMEQSVLATNVAEWTDLADTWRKNPDADASPVENLTLPIEHYDNGRIRAILHAGKAAVGNAGLIWSWQVAVDMFDPAGAPDGRIEAESCLYDRNARRGYCPTAVVLSRTNVVITGTGMYWIMSTQRMQILSNPVVRLQQNLKFPGAGAKPGSGARVEQSPQAPNASGGGTTK